ncbi:uncharacterized protein TRIADDRAFT_51903 [Trichoplax adhaerens]|uniref:MAM domain-containing protein n=1 Tax=Trichoplax adhaerens TaxID=10228 RepID=B3RL74_TRIAD|nr:hypothetical protein TRIADDRAFT_51903 [Trichoplax adhaerens]EDV28712.1 hypothetical protein TRIADDRAFT_51903 [Trichoplax adhaerens]|eukprot:XP_002107914.1 hypothetical protein TRIADDRAFT_51903 [Trichoplax adhaerens]
MKIVPLRSFLLAYVLIFFSFTTGTGSEFCPNNCKCSDTEIKCSNLIAPSFSIPTGIKSLLFEQRIPCDCKYLFPLLWAARLKNVTVDGYCSTPSRFRNYHLDRMFDYLLCDNNLKAGFKLSSVYEFHLKPKHSAVCSFDNGLCGWQQLANIDFFDWKYHHSVGSQSVNAYQEGIGKKS